VIDSRRIRWAGLVTEMRNPCNNSVGKLKGNRPLGIPRRIREDNIRIGWEGVDWILLVQDRNQWRAVVNMVVNLRVL
jgi:hypothetical protein